MGIERSEKGGIGQADSGLYRLIFAHKVRVEKYGGKAS